MINAYQCLGDITGIAQMRGSPTQNAIDDTMNDLFTYTARSIVGAAIGVWLIRRNKKKCGHWKVTDEVGELIN